MEIPYTYISSSIPFHRHPSAHLFTNSPVPVFRGPSLLLSLLLLPLLCEGTALCTGTNVTPARAEQLSITHATTTLPRPTVSANSTGLQERHSAVMMIGGTAAAAAVDRELGSGAIHLSCEEFPSINHAVALPSPSSLSIGNRAATFISGTRKTVSGEGTWRRVFTVIIVRFPLYNVQCTFLRSDNWKINRIYKI